jgi:YCII-related domain
MIARGPTLAADRETATGSPHILGLPSVDAAHEFVAREPNNRAGVYADHFIWRFENLLGRTMWELSGVWPTSRDSWSLPVWIATTAPDGAAVQSRRRAFHRSCASG